MDGVCRDSFGLLNNSIFNVWTCSLCYIYLFPKEKLKFNYDRTSPGLIDVDVRSGYIRKDASDIKSTEYICDSLDEHECTRWKDCCRSAEQCCQHQRDTPLPTKKKFCPRTWDGWGCFDDTDPGDTVKISCPSYIKYGSLQGHVEKSCTDNGTWVLHPDTGKEWTSYKGCVNIKGIGGVVYAEVAANAFSLLLLVPSVAIFLTFRQLRGQQRIQLHVCLFVSFIMTSVLNMIWELVVYSDRIQNPAHETFMFQRQNTCKLINILGRYATATSFFWMFCEGLFLHRLLVHAFRSPRNIRPYCAIGWIGPSIPVCVYSIMRWKFANDICWVNNAGAFEWILYSPNLLSILINLIFLLGILRILLTQLHQHPNEPSNYRRAIKATFVLVPLFGLQLFLVIYRPSKSKWLNVYEIASKLIIGSQGGIIALVFCYFNGEVITCLKNSLRKLEIFKSKRHSLVTNYTVVSQRFRENDNFAREKTEMYDVEHIMLTEPNRTGNGKI
ncbi:calcitonin gene-related peptide type 1 receptor-like [Mercenaria mercenaria]|uniref:calcitonin gene-related peptide type 1 receptor-like n=1 Tax=Mercenaria mercenaria TaxID=6596 RepID=UPI00234FA515|nr:calcitonin gene-related peptide type 1 receptor-like [Mercenaria mercenaria]